MTSTYKIQDMNRLREDLRQIWIKTKSVNDILQYLSEHTDYVVQKEKPKALQGYGIIVGRVITPQAKWIIAISPTGSIRLFKQSGSDVVSDPESFLRKLGIQM